MATLMKLCGWRSPCLQTCPSVLRSYSRCDVMALSGGLVRGTAGFRCARTVAQTTDRTIGSKDSFILNLASLSVRQFGTKIRSCPSTNSTTCRHMTTKSRLGRWHGMKDRGSEIAPTDIVIYQRRPSFFWSNAVWAGGACCLMCWIMAYNTLRAMLESQRRENEKKHIPLTRRGLVTFLLGAGIVFVTGMGVAMLALSWYMPNRAVQKLTLLKGAKAVRLAVHKNFSTPVSREIPMDQVHRLMDAKTANPFATMIIEGRQMSFFMDVKKGTFFEPELFDTYFPKYRPFRETGRVRKLGAKSFNLVMQWLISFDDWVKGRGKQKKRRRS